MAIFEKLRKKSPYDQFYPVGSQQMEEQMIICLQSGQEIPFVLPAFPAKSPNEKTKVLGPDPDLGEEISLRFLHGIFQKMHNILKRNGFAGVNMQIILDGAIYSDILGISDETMQKYRKGLQRIYAEICDGQAPLISFVTPEEILQVSDSKACRETMLKDFSLTPGQVMNFVYENPGELAAFQGISLFLIDDLPELPLTGRSKKQLRRDRRMEAKTVAQVMMFRKRAFDGFIKIYCPGIRLSIHPHLGNAGKVAINLLPGGADTGTPWHNAPICHSDGRVEFMKREKAEKLHGYTLKYKYGNPYCFKPGSPPKLSERLWMGE